jgi:hypothetical protein
MIECVVVFPQHGIQLETHKGFKGLVLSSSRKFIPFANLDDVVINEALYGWNVRYYIVALTRAGNGETVLKVAFPVSLPKSRLNTRTNLPFRRISYHTFPSSRRCTQKCSHTYHAPLQ